MFINDGFIGFYTGFRGFFKGLLYDLLKDFQIF